jgi:hypothetical protein
MNADLHGDAPLIGARAAKNRLGVTDAQWRHLLGTGYVRPIQTVDGTRFRTSDIDALKAGRS